MSISVPVAKGDTGDCVVPAHQGRVVAVAVSAMELLRPKSDLVRLVEGVAHVDLLLAAEDVPVAAAGPVSVFDTADDPDDDDTPDRAAGVSSVHDEVRDGVARLGVPGLRLYRLGLCPPLGPVVEGDLVAALSELVGFDPEPGVYCLAPARAPADSSCAVVNRAAQRIARVYGIPLLRYRCHELSVLGEG